MFISLYKNKLNLYHYLRKKLILKAKFVIINALRLKSFLSFETVVP